MSREDPRTVSGGCRGALYSRSGRQRWRDRRCTWVEDGCLSDSEDRERRHGEKQTCQKKMFGNGMDYLLYFSYGIVGQLQCVISFQ